MISERLDEPTPSGGDYSEILYFDSEMAPADESAATICVIRECMSDGTLVNETWGTCGQGAVF